MVSNRAKHHIYLKNLGNLLFFHCESHTYEKFLKKVPIYLVELHKNCSLFFGKMDRFWLIYQICKSLISLTKDTSKLTLALLKLWKDTVSSALSLRKNFHMPVSQLNKISHSQWKYKWKFLNSSSYVNIWIRKCFVSAKFTQNVCSNLQNLIHMYFQ